MNPERQKLLSKINKLLALSSSECSIPEAESAAAKAYELQLRFNVEHSELQQEEFIRQDDDSFIPHDPSFPHVARILTKYFYVRVVRNTVEDKDNSFATASLSFMGEPHNVEIAIYMGTFLTRTFNATWIKESRSGLRLKKSYQHDFYNAMAEAIMDRLSALREKVLEPGLVLSTSVPGLNSFVKTHYPSLRSIQRTGHADAAARAAGSAAGASVRLQRAATHSAGNGGRLIT